LVSVLEVILIIIIGVLGYWLYLGVKRNDKVGIIIAAILIVVLTLLITGGISLT